MLFVMLLLITVTSRGETFRLLKASNDLSAVLDRDDVSKVLNPEALSVFVNLTSTPNVVGFANGQEYNLSQIEGACQRSNSDIPTFVERGLTWMNQNSGLEMVVVKVKDADALKKIADMVQVLILTHSVRYLVIQTSPDLYPSSTPSMYEDKGMELVVPAITNHLNALYAVGIRVFFSAEFPG